MPTPPPIPSSSASSRPVQRAVFKEVKRVRLGSVQFDYRLIEASHEKAEDWINARAGDMEIVQIQTFHSSNFGITVVWYR